MDYLKDYLSTLPLHQKNAIEQIIGQKKDEGQIKSTEELEKETKKKLEAVVTNQPSPIYSHTNQTGLIDALAFNKELEDLYIDIYTLFSQSLTTDKLIDDHHRLNLSAFSSADQKIKELKDMVDLYERMLENQEEYIFPIYNNFSTSNQEKDPSFYGHTDIANINTSMRFVTLPINSSINRLISPNGSMMGESSIIKYLGRPLESANNNINKSIDGNDKTFWSEVVLSEYPLTLKGEVIDEKLFKNIDSGAAVAIEIDLDYSSPLSSISLKPFSEFPLTVCSINLYNDVNLEKPVLNLIPDFENWINSSDPIIIEFEAINVKKIELILLQKHYILRQYLIEKDRETNIETWKQIKPKNNFSTFLDSEFNSENTSWEDYKNAMDEWHEAIQKASHSDKDLDVISGVASTIPTDTSNLIKRAEDLLGSKISQINQKDLIQKVRYEYVYGLYNVELFYNTYKEIGVFISTPIETKGNIREISLDVTSEIPLVPVEQNDGRIEQIPIGSIEWYIGNNSTWLPINPESINGEKTTQITHERCVIENDGTIGLRFPVKNGSSNKDSIDLYSNGVKVNRDLWAPSLEFKNSSCSFKVEESLQETYLTVSYPIDRSIANTIDFQSVLIPKTIKEVFGPTTDSKEERLIELSNYPYINYSLINNAEGYNPINMQIQSDSLMGDFDWVSTKQNNPDGYKIKNVTNYKKQELPILKKVTEENKTYEFRQKQKEITISDELKDATITVEYSALTENVRVKAVLIKNLPGYNSLTPKIRNYTIKPKVINLF